MRPSAGGSRTLRSGGTTEPDPGGRPSPGRQPARGHRPTDVGRHTAGVSRVPPISSARNPRFREVLALREARARRARRLVLVDGAREIAAALDSGARTEELWISTDGARSAGAAVVVSAARDAGVRLVEAAPSLLAKLAYGERDEGVVGVFAMPAAGLSDLDASGLPAEPLIGVVERVEKPGNLGAIARIADGAGLDALIVADPTSDPWNPNAIRASLGTLFSLRLAVCAGSAALAWLRERGLRIVAARVDGARDWDQVDLRAGVAVVLGSEARGLSDLWRGEHVTGVRIPMLGRADSLNVAASAAVLFYEARRQRRGERAR
jgi:RNA methyltransferase, TrmH family